MSLMIVILLVSPSHKLAQYLYHSNVKTLLFGGQSNNKEIPEPLALGFHSSASIGKDVPWRVRYHRCYVIPGVAYNFVPWSRKPTTNGGLTSETVVHDQLSSANDGTVEKASNNNQSLLRIRRLGSPSSQSSS